MEYTTDSAGFRSQASLHQALAHPVRLQILDILARGEACVCHLTAMLGRRQPYVSQQLAALRDAGLVSDRREGTLVYYRIRDARLVALLALGQTIVAPDDGVVRVVAGGPAGGAVDCPCPKCQGAGTGAVQAVSIPINA